MTLSNLLQEAKKLELQEYKKPSKIKEMKDKNIPFSGSPQKHPYDSDKVVLITDPYGGVQSYYEFNTEDISYVEELPAIVNIEGETMTMVRVWIKKGSVGIRCTPFLIEGIHQNK